MRFDLTNATTTSPAAAGAAAPKGLFLGENTIGNRTIYENWKVAAEGKNCTVALIDFSSSSIVDRIPLPHQIRSSIALRRKLARLLRDVAPDYLVTSTYNALKLAHDIVGRVPTAVMIDCTPVQFDELRYSEDRSDRLPGVRKAKHVLMRAVFDRAAALLPMSRWAARSVIRDYRVPPERVLVMPPGVNTDMWRPAEKHGTSPAPDLVFVGGDFERKGGFDLLEWFRRRGRGRARLTLVTRAQIPEEEGVRVVRAEPNSPELRELVRSSDVFVLPTRADCFSHATCEAMASGLPVVVGDVGGIADLVEDGVTGYLVPPGASRTLDEALGRLLASDGLRRSMGAAGRKRAVANHDSRRSFDRMLELGAAISTQRSSA